MNWASRRKLIFAGIFLVLIIMLVGVPAFLFLYKEPTCTDMKQNGEEQGIDCGGACTQLCRVLQTSPVVLWQQAFKISPGVYTLGAYIQNPNISAKAYNVPYTFSVYDASSTVITTRKGTAYIPPGKNFIILENSVVMGDRVPTRVVFELDNNITWLAVRERLPDLAVTNSVIKNYSDYSSVEADVQNPTLKSVGRVEVSVIVYNSAGNAVTTSKTFVDELAQQSKTKVVFTWPGALPTETKTCDVPTDIMVGIDRSGSMASEGKDPPQPLESVKSAAISFVDLLRKSDAIGLVSFATTPTLDLMMGQNAVAVKQAIQAISIATEGTQYTNIAETIITATKEIVARKRTTAHQALIILTDGAATYPLKKGDASYPAKMAIEAADAAKQQGIEVFTIGLGSTIDKDVLRAIASSADHFYVAPTSADVAQVYEKIAEAICVQGAVKVEIITETPDL